MSATMGGRIENEFVPYEQALVLKELGFDEPCLGYYTIYSDGEVKLFTSDKGFRNLEASTFSQAFRWFRERYQIDSWIYPNHNGLYSVSIVRRGVGLGNLSQYQTYPEAELSCLIKLIEITNESKRT